MRIIITGGNSGVGKATAAAAAESGHNVVIACRNIEKAERAAADMPADVEVAHLDDLNWHTRRYSKTAAYAESKLANLLFIRELASLGIRAYASDPGMTDTGITRKIAAGIPMAERARRPAIRWRPVGCGSCLPI
jgi:NAD(P)-dependent dehydrogenase (short-subunit alcohol dehydrogenase family)